MIEPVELQVSRRTLGQWLLKRRCRGFEVNAGISEIHRVRVTRQQIPTVLGHQRTDGVREPLVVFQGRERARELNRRRIGTAPV